MAQDAATTTDAAAKPAEAKPADDVTAVTVVGSRIRKDTFNSASPIEVITRKEAVSAGLTSTAEILQSTAVTGGSSQINNSYGNYIVGGGAGANTVGLRGLGPNRTLVLINGRRVSPAGSGGSIGAADLNTLPNALIGNVEILRDGASAIYGSDAIGGVINIVTRKVDGLSMEVQGSVPEAKGGTQSRVSLVGGKTSGNFNIQGSLEYYDQTAVKYADRDWTKCQIDYFRDPSTGDLLDSIDPTTGKAKCYPVTGSGDSGVTINTLGTAAFGGVPGAGVAGTQFTRWRPNSSVTTGLPGYEGVGGSGIDINARDTFDPRMLNQDILSPTKNYTGFLQASYKLPNFANSEIYGELLYNKRKSEQTDYRQLSLDYPVGSPLIPADIAAIPSPVGGAGFSTLFPEAVQARAFIGFGNSTARQEVNFTKATGGIRGDFLPLYLQDWQYDAYVQYSDSDASYSTQQFFMDRMNASLHGCVNAPGSGCVSAPMLTPDTIAGKLPADWVNYVFLPTQSTSKFREISVTANVNGPLFKLPAGEVQAAFGIEHRYAEIDDEPDINSINGNLLNYSTAAPTIGHDGVTEAYGELNVPVLKNLPLAKELSLELAARYTDDDRSGSADTYKVGLVWAPFSWLTLRGSKGTSFRAPALYELFQGATTGYYAQDYDPCYVLSAQPHATAARQANCAAELNPALLDANGDFVQKNSVVDISQGGAGSGLRPETSDNTTIGFIFKPDFLPSYLGKFNFAVDRFDIEINNGVTQLGLNLLDLCYDAPGFRAAGSYCNYVSRDAGTGELTIQDGYVNVARQTAKGYDYDFRWTQRFGDVSARVDASVTQFTEQGQALLLTDDLMDYNNLVTYPSYSGNLDVSVSYHNWSVRYGLDWIGATDSSTPEAEDTVRGVDPYVYWTDDYYLHNISVTYNSDNGWTAVAGIRNVGDAQPPMVSATARLFDRIGNAPLYSGYDLYGRQYFFDISKKF